LLVIPWPWSSQFTPPPEFTVPHPLLTVPVSHRVGLTSISLGLLRCLDRNGIKVGFFKPVAQLRYGPRANVGLDVERSSSLVGAITDLEPPTPLSTEEVERLLGNNGADELQERILSAYQRLAARYEAIVIEGMVPTDQHPFATQVNHMIADAAALPFALSLRASGRTEAEEHSHLTKVMLFFHKVSEWYG